jgi:L-amino acid N-acyltransferase YncA
MKIRKSRNNDFEKILQIYLEGSIDEQRLQFPKKSVKKIQEEQNKTKPSIVKYLKNHFNSKKRIFLVVEEKKEVVGFGEAYVEKAEGQVFGGFGRVYISKEFRGNGLGTKITKKLLEYLKKKKVKKIESYVYINNKLSLGLHDKLGFRKEEYKMVKEFK